MDTHLDEALRRWREDLVKKWDDALCAYEAANAAEREASALRAKAAARVQECERAYLAAVTTAYELAQTSPDA